MSSFVYLLLSNDFQMSFKETSITEILIGCFVVDNCICLFITFMFADCFITDVIFLGLSFIENSS